MASSVDIFGCQFSVSFAFDISTCNEPHSRCATCFLPTNRAPAFINIGGTGKALFFTPKPVAIP